MAKRKLLNTKGFTIVELMIAMTVFSILLLLVSGAIVQLSRKFYKGLVQARTQEVARTVVEEFSNNVKFSASDVYPLTNTNPGSDVRGRCVADRRYMYVLSKKLGQAPGESKGVLMRGGSCTDNLPAELEPVAGHVELMAENMRLVSLTFLPDATDKVWHFKVRVAYGGNDLFCSPSSPGDCESETESSHLNADDLVCKTQSGLYYCAVSEYEATVARRL